MRDPKTILLIGTADTKSPELSYLADLIRAADGRPLLMDVGVLTSGTVRVDITNSEVARAAGTTLAEVIALGDENHALTKMGEGAATLARRYRAEQRIDGVLVLGGSMGTDLGLDVAWALPLGFPKLLVSTIAYSHLIPPHRIPADLMMILWAGGLYGLNDIGRSSLAQAAGAILGAARSARPPSSTAPLIGMTSLGTSCLRYVEHLLPALEQRGYEVAVFHTTGMGGQAFESLAAEGRFAAVMDFSLQELMNHLGGSVVTAGPHRLESAGDRGIPQLVAPGAIDMIDFPAWRPMPQAVETAPGFHAHNRLIASVSTDLEDRRRIARLIADKLEGARGPTVFLLPLRGIEAWDREDEPLHNPAGLQAFVDEARASIRGAARLVEVDAHINDREFANLVLSIFDGWVANGIVPAGKHTFDLVEDKA